MAGVRGSLEFIGGIGIMLGVMVIAGLAVLAVVGVLAGGGWYLDSVIVEPINSHLGTTGTWVLFAFLGGIAFTLAMVWAWTHPDIPE